MKGHIPLDSIQWLRPSEFVPTIADGKSPTLFVDGADSGDIVQGALGDCWFLSAVACVAPRRELIRALFASTEYSQKGIYTLRFFKHGKWKLVSIDDRIPCTPNGRPLYAHGSQPHETWVMLLEKAYAKINGRCYQNLNRGSISYALKDLTGGDPQARTPFRAHGSSGVLATHCLLCSALLSLLCSARRRRRGGGNSRARDRAVTAPAQRRRDRARAQAGRRSPPPFLPSPSPPSSHFPRRATDARQGGGARLGGRRAGAATMYNSK